MHKHLIALGSFVYACIFSYGQKLDNLKLDANEMPIGYVKSDSLISISSKATSFYEQASLYSAYIGYVKSKSFQSFEAKADKGTIFYFEFEKDFQGKDFLSGLLWGDKGKPTKEYLDELYVKNNVVVIWSFNRESQVKNKSIEKIKTILK